MHSTPSFCMLRRPIHMYLYRTPFYTGLAIEAVCCASEPMQRYGWPGARSCGISLNLHTLHVSHDHGVPHFFM